MRLKSRYFRRKLLNPSTKPGPYFLFELCLIVLPLQLLNGLTITIQRNEVTGHVLRPVRRAHKLEQVTFSAGMSTIRVNIVKTGQGILKDRFTLPGSPDRSSVSTLLDEV